MAELSHEERAVVKAKLSADDSSIMLNIPSHDLTDPADEVAAAWKAEIARRLEEVRQGTARTVPAIEAERMIRGEIPLPN